MYFSIGAHPAFNCNLGDTLTFEYNETLYSERIDRDSVITGDKDLILQNSNKIEITEHLFDKDALIFSQSKNQFYVLYLATDFSKKRGIQKLSSGKNLNFRGVLSLKKTKKRGTGF